MLLQEFLEENPPNEVKSVDLEWSSTTPNSFLVPPIRSYCDIEECNRAQIFDPTSATKGPCYVDQLYETVICFICRNCKTTRRRISLLVDRDKDGRVAFMKFGEWPAFGPRTHSRLIKLIGPDRELFLKGRRAESYGLGIGAFGYYRRVVENQRDRLIDQIIEVANGSDLDRDFVAQLELAKKETQFSKAVEMIKGAIPASLKIDGHNPLVLLHAALSEGIHSDTEETCLEMAQHIRVVLNQFAERLADVARTKAELKAAISRLLNPQA